MLEPLLKDFRSGTREGLLQAARRAFMLAFAALALPGLPLGALYAVLGRPARLDWLEGAALLVQVHARISGAVHPSGQHRRARHGERLLTAQRFKLRQVGRYHPRQPDQP